MMTPQSTERSGSVPGRKWYAVAVLVFLAGMTVFAVFLFARLSELGDDFVRVTMPGQAELPLDPGPYTIFHERGGMTDSTGGGVITAGDITGLRISVQNPGTGTAVPLTASAGSRYTLSMAAPASRCSPSRLQSRGLTGWSRGMTTDTLVRRPCSPSSAAS